MEPIIKFFNYNRSRILLVQLSYSWSQGVKVEEWVFSVVDANGHWLIQGLETLIADCGDLIIDIGARDFDALEPTLEVKQGLMLTLRH